MPKSRLDQYRGELTAAQLSDGINAARRNAVRLAEDARTLLANDRYPSAAALAILSIEEAGKVSVLRELALARDAEERVTAWRAYRSHTKKNVSWILPQLVADGARDLEAFRPIFDNKSDHAQVLDQVKQISLYTDCLGKAHWSVPAEVIEPAMAHSLVHIAELLAGSSKSDTSPEEIELWIKHLRPVWKGDLAWMKTALLNWRRDMEEHGLLPDDEGGFERFVHGASQSEGV